MPWSVTLCVYKSSSMTDVGHAFATVSHDGEIVAAAGLSPGQLPASFLQEMSTVIPGPGRIYSEWDSMGNENLRTRSWDVPMASAVAVLNKINEDRRSNVSVDVPDGDETPAHRLVELSNQAMDEGREWAGGPDYALLWSNCASYALDLVEAAGINVQQYRFVVNNPAWIHSLLGRQNAA